MENKPYPEFLYRYRAYNTDEQKAWVRQIIIENKLYAASPNSFNDPFDCRIEVSLDANAKEELKYIMSAQKIAGSKKSPADRLVEARRYMNVAGLKSVDKSFPRRTFENIGVIAFSASNNNILLWSHYADCHKGVCFQFRSAQQYFSFDHGTVIQTLKVNYSETYPSVRLVDVDDRHRLLDVILTKSTDWEYEDEYRFINHKSGEGFIYYPEKHLSGIIFGCEMNEKERQEIRDMVAQREHKPVFYQAKKTERQFGLVIEPVAS